MIQDLNGIGLGVSINNMRKGKEIYIRRKVFELKLIYDLLIFPNDISTIVLNYY